MVRSLAQQLRDVARERGDAPWLTTPRERTSWSQAWDGTRRAAAGLLDVGIGPGDRVGIFCRNGVEFIEMWFGAQAIGATVVPVNTGFTAREASYVLNHANVRLVLVDTDTAPVVRSALDEVPSLTTVVVLDHSASHGALGAMEVSFASFVDQVEIAASLVHEPSDTDMASILYTSGTTGPPKGCMQGHGYFAFGARSVAAQLRLTSDDVMMCVLPLFHMNAQASSVATSLHVGAHLVLEDRFSARGFWPRVREMGVTEFSYLGIISAALAKLPPSQDDRDHQLRVGFGAGMPADLHATFEARFGIAMLEVFGMTETCIDLSTDLVPDRRIGRRALGTAVPGKQARIVDDAGDTVPAGVVGHLQVRGDGMFQGYLDDEAATQEAFDGDWFRTGDLASRDEDDWFYYVDRSKDLIRRAGENIGSVEVEAVLAAHPRVATAAVIGVEDEMVGQEVKALVVLVVLQDGRAGSDEVCEDILRHCAAHLATFKVPRYLQVLSEFPRTESMKIRKTDLRRDFATARDSYERPWRKVPTP